MSKAYNGLGIVPGSRILENMDGIHFFYTKLIHGLEIIGHDFEMKAKSSSDNLQTVGRPCCIQLAGASCEASAYTSEHRQLQLHGPTKFIEICIKGPGIRI